MTSKQRAYLRGIANKIETILIVGKDGITDTVIKQAEDALEAREIIKIRCLENAAYSIRETAEEIAEVCGADVIQVIGTRAVLYRPSKKPKICLPK